MIIYNMRYRGPFEYDKFALNIFQIYNETKKILEEFNEEKEKATKSEKDNIEYLFNELVSDNSLLERTLKIKEEMRDLIND